ncbi:unnamed protein product [Arctia plantaginis]|uniref:Uncharacterized protein n=1 Tax=Arctia plantaginis TaxID=874455 RepID=A0A8S0Z7S2_ARCPL|nr:unnamed protein product [Arctia plantaginis]
MSAPSKVNKENFRLLDLSSEEESEDLQLEIIPSRKKKITRRERIRGPTVPAQEPNIGAEVQCALRWAVRGTLLLWLLMLTWICAALYDQVSIMRTDMNQGFLMHAEGNSSGVNKSIRGSSSFSVNFKKYLAETYVQKMTHVKVGQKPHTGKYRKIRV